MALRLESAIKLHQALHGYADGHRLLASSVKLKSHDQKTLLIMSDVSGAGATLDSDGYLTGYPLPDSGLYAVGRTWSANEMPRPGCVWTHTVLIDFTDLALLSSMMFLRDVFRKPSMNFPNTAYSEPFTIEIPDASAPVVLSSIEYISRIVAALYEFPESKILGSADAASEQITLMVWGQQWPRLRRSFRFCTLSFADRSTETAPFDLQFTRQRERSIRSRFDDVIDVDRVESSSVPWLSDAVEDIASAPGGELRSFLREFGGDISGGREMFVPLCQLFRTVRRSDDAVKRIDDAVALIDEGKGSSFGETVRARLASLISRYTLGVSDRSINFLLSNLYLLDKVSIGAHWNEFMEGVWRREPEEIVSMIESESPGHEIAREVLAGLPLSELLARHGDRSNLVWRVFALQPDLLLREDTWRAGGSWCRALLHSKHDLSTDVVYAILDAGRFDLFTDAVRRFGASRILTALSERIGVDASEKAVLGYARWFEKLSELPSSIAEFFCSGASISLRFLLEIAKWTHPEAIPNAYGTDPWVIAVDRAAGRLPETGNQYLCAYLLARSLGYSSRSQSQLIEFSFDEIYFGALHNRLTNDSWRFLDRSLPRSWISDWDRCQKLRDAVTDLFVNRHLPPEGFLRITKDDSLFADLARLASYTSRGRKFLKKVRECLRESGGSQSRIEAIESLLWW